MRSLTMLMIMTLILGCTQDLEKADIFPYDIKTWDRINSRSSEGEGNNEFEKNRDKQAATEEIDLIKDRLFYTDRIAYRIEDWKNKTDELKSWASIPQGIIAQWSYDLLDGEPRVGTYMPWLISGYSFTTNSFVIWPAPFDCLKGNSDRLANKAYTSCFGDPPPTIYTENGGSIYTISSYNDNWAWYSGEVLLIEMNEARAEEFISVISNSSICLRVYYKYFSIYDNAVIVSVRGYIQNGEIKTWLFTTEYHDEKKDEETVRADGINYWYYDKFVF